MPSFAIRSIYHFGVNSSGINVFEERIVGFIANSAEEAHEKAEVEAEQYAAEYGYEVHSEQIGYQLENELDVQACELWSELYESQYSLSEFYHSRYSAFLYEPE